MEPNRLLLVWQSLGGEGEERLRRIVGELLRKNVNDSDVVFRYLRNTLDFELARQNGFLGYPAFKLKKEAICYGVLETFLRRLPPRGRLDFEDYLENFRILPDMEISDFSLLGYSEAKLPGDGFSIINPLDEARPPFEFLTEISGFRYFEGMKLDLKVGDPVGFEEEPDNRIDPFAVRVMVGKNKIGYINKVQANSLRRFLKRKIFGFIDRINGISEQPVVKLFIKVG